MRKNGFRGDDLPCVSFLCSDLFIEREKTLEVAMAKGIKERKKSPDCQAVVKAFGWLESCFSPSQPERPSPPSDWTTAPLYLEICNLILGHSLDFRTWSACASSNTRTITFPAVFSLFNFSASFII
ncbi:hypothetical protein PROFUN_03104 [Planoprotostelium fungivorum]|uniref:Uncharacterized protein n=1 Tax=Planoprotostelium fungivorum TaxID=1890364 RepID=A0A2P6NQ83_9EUKA|nr:hypothetical protein PROFUN_03104 [Planoprotostelium fungivorum]